MWVGWGKVHFDTSIYFDFVAAARCSALFTAIDFEPVLCEVKAHFVCNFFYQTLQFLTFKFVDLSSFNIQQMVMIRAFNFKACFTISHIKLFN